MKSEHPSPPTPRRWKDDWKLQQSPENASLSPGSDRFAVGTGRQGERGDGDQSSFQSALRRRRVGGGDEPYQDEPTLEILTPDYDVIVFKHCFPVSNIEPDTGSGDVASEEKRLENYQLQYAALKEKLRSFPETRFIVWTAAAQVGTETDQSQAQRAKSFVDWVRNAWDQPGDNIYVWDFYALETEGGLYLKPDYSQGYGYVAFRIRSDRDMDLDDLRPV